MSAVYICSFTAGLDELTRKQQRDAVAVLRVLKASGRFSIFEATENQTIAVMLDRLLHKGYSVVRDGVRTDYGRLIEKTGGQYPWTNVKLTAGGIRLLSDAEERP